jgi:hypothetical protein
MSAKQTTESEKTATHRELVASPKNVKRSVKVSFELFDDVEQRLIGNDTDRNRSRC